MRGRDQLANSPDYWEKLKINNVPTSYCMCPRENHNDVQDSGAVCLLCGGLVR